MDLNRLEDYGLGEISDWASLIFPRVVRAMFILDQEGKPVVGSGGKQKTSLQTIGYILVIDRGKFGDRAQWKLPGGHKKKVERCKPSEKPDETPLDTALRELEGETGIRMPLRAFVYCGKWLHWRHDHWKCLFIAELGEDDIAWMHNHHPENEGEEAKFFTVEEFYALVREGKCMREHYEMLVEYTAVLPFGRDKQLAEATA
ncbi:NUDIX hydrolase [Patescibacteria group bacterium]|nr:NUDIX hydrolase [Patescibacteria group bacterium]